MSVIMAARELRKLQFWVRAEQDPDFLVFARIASETDELPAGSERRHWAAEALKAKDAQIASLEAAYQERALVAAKNLIQKYERIVEPAS
jgi:hypothetical protein